MGRYLDFIHNHDEVPWSELVDMYYKYKCGSSHLAREAFEKECLKNWPTEQDAEASAGRTSFVFDCLLHLLDAYARKRKKLDEALRYLFGQRKRVLSVTLTFTPEVLGQYSEEELEKAAIDWLESKSAEFVLNRDYRPNTGAFHLHAYVKRRYLNPREWEAMGFGFAKVKEAHYTKKRQARYMTKYERHCIKASTGGARVYYSSGVRQRLRPLETERVHQYNVYEVRITDRGNAEVYEKKVRSNSKANVKAEAEQWRASLFKEWEVRAFGVTISIRKLSDVREGVPYSLFEKEEKKEFDLEAFIGHPIGSKRRGDDE